MKNSNFGLRKSIVLKNTAKKVFAGALASAIALSGTLINASAYNNLVGVRGVHSQMANRNILDVKLEEADLLGTVVDCYNNHLQGYIGFFDGLVEVFLEGDDVNLVQNLLENENMIGYLDFLRRDISEYFIAYTLLNLNWYADRIKAGKLQFAISYTLGIYRCLLELMFVNLGINENILKYNEWIGFRNQINQGIGIDSYCNYLFNLARRNVGQI